MYETHPAQRGPSAYALRNTERRVGDTQRGDGVRNGNGGGRHTAEGRRMTAAASPHPPSLRYPAATGDHVRLQAALIGQTVHSRYIHVPPLRLAHWRAPREGPVPPRGLAPSLSWRGHAHRAAAVPERANEESKDDGPLTWRTTTRRAQRAPSRPVLNARSVPTPSSAPASARSTGSRS